MLDWKQRVKDKCAQYGATCVESGNGLIINGQFMTITGIESLGARHQDALNDLVDYRLAQYLPQNRFSALLKGCGHV